MNNIRFSYLQFIVLAATILLVIWFYQTYTIDIQQHDRSVDTLLKLKQEEKRLDRDTLQIISLQLIQYDPLVKTTANIRSLIELLNSQKTGLYGQINTDIDQKLLAYESALEEKTAILERIKTQAALVRNSLHYLPIAVSELQFESKDRITGLLSNQLHYNIFPSETEEQHLRRELESINDLKTTPEIRSMLDNVRLHMLANLRDRKQLNSLKDSYISVPTVQRFDELYTAYASNYTSQIQTAEHFGWGLLVITIVLFTNLWLAMRRLSTAQRVAQRAWAQLDDAMESLSEAFALFDAQGRLVLRNSKFAEFYPWLRDELVPGATLSLLEQRSKELGFFQPPEKPGNTGPYFSMNITDAKGSSYLQRLADGRRYKASDSKTSEGGMACVRVNITDHLQTEEDLRKLSRAVEQSPATVVITDAEGTIEYANPKFEDTTGFKLDEVIGQNPRILKSGTKKQKDYKEMWDTIQSGHVWHGEFQNRRKDGSMYHEAASISPVRDYNGVITHFIAVKEDITERKQTELELQNYREHLEDEVAKRTEQLAHAKKVAEVATQAKSYFLANMSHEIRTPMNTIIGMSHLALLSNLDSKQRNYIEKVHLSAENLLGILNDILDFSKIEAGKMEMEVTSFQLKEVIDHTLNLIKLKAGEKNIRLSVLIEHGVPATLIGDPLRLSQVLINLSSNAVKFSGDGDTVSLKIFLMEKSNDDVVLRFSVEDTGIGLSKEQQKKLFTAFSQADSSTTRKYGGSGLGLVISKKFVQMMDGEIDVDSELGVGSTFSFTARLGIQQAGQAAQETSSDKNNDDELASQAINHLRGAKILVVEDNVLNQELILELLTMNGLNVQVAHNGKEALELIAREDFDGVLMDCQMPIMDGYEATRKIREQQKYKFLPIIAMTANTMSGDREITLKSGMNDYIAKPIKASTMFIVMGKWITPGKE